MRKLPSHLEFMVSETYRYFSHSTLRQQKYAQLYSTINVGEQPLKLQQLSETRWLAIAPCLTRVLQQYDELKLHFEISKHEEMNYTADLLHQMYSDPANKLYQVFLQPVVSQVNRVNKMFEMDHCNVSKLLAELMSLYKSILGRLMIPRTFSTWKAVTDFDMKNDRNHLPLQAVDFGVQFNIELARTRTSTITTRRLRPRFSSGVKPFGVNMTVFVCAVADCKSSSKKSADNWPEMTNVKGWAKFPSVKREPKRRKLWESRCKRGAGWKATRFHRVCSRHFNNWEETRPSSFHPDPELFNYNDWGKKHSQRSRNVWQSNSDAIQHEIDLVKPDVDVLQQDPVPEPIIIEDVDVIGAEVDIHSNMDQASYLIATPEPHRDHTYSSVSRDTTDASEPVDFGMQISQPVCHAETQTHEMFAHACAAEKNSVLRLSFKEKLLSELQQRLPSNIHHLQTLDTLSPETVLGLRKPKLQDLSFLMKYSGDIGKLDEQWQLLGTVSWPMDVLDNEEKFWMTVHGHHDASGEQDFKEVGQFALSMLALPFSNASVERVFSQMNLVKNKLRNRMQNKSLENTLHVRAFMQRNYICCNKFSPTREMLSRFSNDMYASGGDVNEHIDIPCDT
ncbi:hypothetical protein Pcinc_003734 [Petrolisthes cinctipes]|uniref:THAP-type domain-containing protein n=1 Tax=Petrolisthes cinctipes TaxID=88211 RepID=A0AAE1GN47_PETCI|nr:hypothetical protein Pcinc_003734 [Petrolisthes cinctipes]